MLEVWGPIGNWSHLLAMSRTAERTGLDSVWVPDHLVMGGQPGELPDALEAWTLITALAAATDRISVGSLVLCARFRNPALTAKMAATFDRIAPRRLILGVSAGSYQPEFEMFGLPAGSGVGRFEEWIEILVRLLRGERVTFSGRHFSMRDAALEPPPENRIPILIGSTRPRMNRLTARWADSWSFPPWHGAPSERLAEGARTIGEALHAVGRERDSLELTASMIVRDPDQAVAGETIPARWDSAFTGSVEELAAALTEFTDYGFEQIVVKLQPATTRSVERLSEAVGLVRARTAAANQS
jgi:FMNH2-dependent dimethyl sulfone monooxygenase